MPCLNRILLTIVLSSLCRIGCGADLPVNPALEPADGEALRKSYGCSVYEWPADARVLLLGDSITAGVGGGFVGKEFFPQIRSIHSFEVMGPFAYSDPGVQFEYEDDRLHLGIPGIRAFDIVEAARVYFEHLQAQQIALPNFIVFQSINDAPIHGANAAYVVQDAVAALVQLNPEATYLLPGHFGYNANSDFNAMARDYNRKLVDAVEPLRAGGAKVCLSRGIGLFSGVNSGTDLLEAQVGSPHLTAEGGEEVAARLAADVSEMD